MVEKVGSEKPVRVDVRIISPTNKNLEYMVRKQQFREDLYINTAKALGVHRATLYNRMKRLDLCIHDI